MIYPQKKEEKKQQVWKKDSLNPAR